jgi:hypothetical protein
VALEMAPFELRTLALDLAAPGKPLPSPTASPLELPFDRTSTSHHGDPTSPRFDRKGRSIPGELFPRVVTTGGLGLPLGPGERGAVNCVTCAGQELELPAGDFTELVLLATAVDGEAHGAIVIGDRHFALRVPDWGATIGRWVYRRFWGPFQVAPAKLPLLERTPIAWVSTHRHDARVRDLPYDPGFLYRFVLPVPAGATRVRLPREPRIRLFAAAAVAGSNFGAAPASVLYD